MPEEKDNCEVCRGDKGGTPGNENIINGWIACDYCHADGTAVQLPPKATCTQQVEVVCSTMPVAVRPGTSAGWSSGWIPVEMSSVCATTTGSWADIERIVDRLGEVDAVLWFADIPNDKPKVSLDIKRRWPKLYLVTSKRNLDQSYTMSELLGRALKSKSNLLVEMTGDRTCVQATVLDPLGVAYCVAEKDVAVVADVLVDRLVRLATFQRVGSRQIGDALAPPDEAEFYAIVRAQAERFHEIIHGVGHERMMGNASFRCARGFPSVYHAGMVSVPAWQTLRSTFAPTPTPLPPPRQQR